MKGYAYVGMVIIEVEVISDTHVQWKYMSDVYEYKPHKSMIRYAKDGRAYFHTEGHNRVYLDECLRQEAI